MAEHESKGGVSIPWANLTALFIAVVGGLTLLFDPLVSSRPQRGSRPLAAAAEQDVDARLWQDPLRVAVEHFEKAAASRADVVPRNEQKLAALRSKVADSRQPQAPGGQRTLILPVAIPGGPYAEDNERRLRTRQAVISGLAASGFTPDDGEHIGYFILPPPGWDNLQIQRQTSNLPAYLVPFEWFLPRYGDASLVQPEGLSRILIVWFRDDVPGTEWLGRLHSLGTALEWDTSVDLVRVVGPASSTSLARILRENATGRATDWLQRLGGVHLYAPLPTASEETITLLTRAERSPLTNGSLRAGPTLHRTINTDDETAAALIEELKLRGTDLVDNVQPRSPEGIARFFAWVRSYLPQSPPGPRRFKHVAVIGEWDTLYGRALPVTFLAEIFKAAGQPKKLREFMGPGEGERANSGVPEWFHSFTYSRGIDGRLPGEGPSEKGKSSQPAEAAARPREATEGEDQSDYLRRLAAQLAAMHHELKRTGSEGLKAVGVLGSDVYDKLMILRALRKALPGVLFFTDGLDARLGMEEEWRATRNLIVASPYSLSLAPEYQRNSAPFRDSYQTAVFASTLMITGAMREPTRPEMQPARMFEIARNGPWDLSVTRRYFDPPRFDTQEWFGNRGRKWSSVIGILGVIALLIWIGITAGWIGLGTEPAGGFRAGQLLSGVFTNSGAATVLAVVIALLCVWGFVANEPASGEPLAWLQGISVWPTEMVRVIVIILCIHFAWKSRNRLRRSDRDIEREHHLCPAEAMEGVAGPATWKESIRSLALRGIGEAKAVGRRVLDPHPGWRSKSIDEGEVAEGRGKPEEQRRIQAEKLWQEYLERGHWTRRWLRFGPMIVFYIIAGLSMFVLLGFPHVPARGPRSFLIDLILLIGTVASTTTLLFYVVDAIRLNRDFIELFNQGITIWPKGAELKEPRHRILSKEELAEYLDIKLIAARTEVVCPLVNYPFVTLVLMIVARNSYFDNWEWPLSLIAILGLNLGWAIYCSLQLYHAARKARRTAVDRLAGHRLQALHSVSITANAEQREQLKTRVKLIEETSAEIQSLRRGAFAPLSDQPFFRAILFSSGGIGVGTMLQYLPSLF